jgi:hypothetical protein
MEQRISAALRHAKSAVMAFLAPVLYLIFMANALRIPLFVGGAAFVIYSASLFVTGTGGRVDEHCNANSEALLVSWLAPRVFWQSQREYYERILATPHVPPSFLLNEQMAELTASLAGSDPKEDAALKRELQALKESAGIVDDPNAGRIQQLRDEADRLEQQSASRQMDAWALVEYQKGRQFAQRCAQRATAELSKR